MRGQTTQVNAIDVTIRLVAVQADGVMVRTIRKEITTLQA